MLAPIQNQSIPLDSFYVELQMKSVYIGNKWNCLASGCVYGVFNSACLKRNAERKVNFSVIKYLWKMNKG